MAAPPTTSPASDPVSSAPPSASSHPPPRPSLPSSLSSSPRPPPPPSSPLFSGHPLAGRPLNPPPPPQAILYPVTSAPHRAGFAPKPAPRPPAAADHVVTVANPAAYLRNASPTTVVAFAPAHARPSFAFGGSDHSVPASAAAHVLRSLPQAVPPFTVPRAVGVGAGGAAAPPRSVPITTQPKVTPFPAVARTIQYADSKERDRNREEAVVVINDRKVRLLDGESGSLYSLCRSWVQNGLPLENQPTFGDGEPLLPKPLPASLADSDVKEEDSNEDDLPRDEELVVQVLIHHCLLSTDRIRELLIDVGFGVDCRPAAHGNLIVPHTARHYLDEHIRRAKRIRARLQKDRLRRITRYKQRLALLLPPPGELGRHDTAAGN